MLKTLSDKFYGATNKYTLTVVTLIFLAYLLWILPNSRDVDRIIGSGAALIVPWFQYLLYTPADFYSQLDAYGPEGRQAFVDYRLFNATLWLLTMGAFFTLTICAFLRSFTEPDSWQRQPVLIAPVPSLCDFLENKLQIMLVLLYPDRYDSLAILAAALTAVKWITLGMTFIIFFYAATRTLNSKISGVIVQR